MNNQTNIDRLDLAGVRLAIRLAETNLAATGPNRPWETFDDYIRLVSRIEQLQARAARLTAQVVK